MIKALKESFTGAILQEAVARYGLAPEQVKSLGGWESFVYAYSRNGRSYILKITHTMRRTENYIMGELEWLNFLADRGVSVARAVPSEGGRLVERIDAGGGGAWLITVYEQAPGHKVMADDWNEALFATWGRLVGRTHRLTQSYRLSNPAYKRQEWYEEEQLKANKYLPASEGAVLARADELLTYLHALPTPPDAYGMLHTDLHHGNFFVDQGQITAFDFDDAHYNWFASDIAVSLLGALHFPPSPHDDRAAFAQHFLEHFFRGYYRENRLDPMWLKHIPDFLMLRDILLFISVYQGMDVAAFDERQRAQLDEHRRRVVGRIPLVDLDWMQFAQR